MHAAGGARAHLALWPRARSHAREERADFLQAFGRTVVDDVVECPECLELEARLVRAELDPDASTSCRCTWVPPRPELREHPQPDVDEALEADVDEPVDELD
jgi:hypothetical protein